MTSRPDNHQPDDSLDMRGGCGAFCLLKILGRVDAMEPGQRIEVWGTDPNLASDLPRLIGLRGGQVASITEEDGFFRLLLLKR